MWNVEIAILATSRQNHYRTGNICNPEYDQLKSFLFLCSVCLIHEIKSLIISYSPSMFKMKNILTSRLKRFANLRNLRDRVDQIFIAGHELHELNIIGDGYFSQRTSAVKCLLFLFMVFSYSRLRQSEIYNKLRTRLRHQQLNTLNQYDCSPIT